MRPAAFQIFRMNLRDREGLFNKPIRSDQDLISVLLGATKDHCDLEDKNRRSGFRWSLRSASVGAFPDRDRPFVILTFVKELLYTKGKVISSDGMRTGVSYSDPPLAQGTAILVDLRRHVVAVQESFQVMKGPNMVWKKKLERILSYAAHWESYTSNVELDPIAPRPFIESELRRFDRITRLRVTLSIPNPDLNETYRRLYEEMERGGVREFTEDMRSERGLDLSSQTLPAASLDMALNGYRSGAIRIDGYVDGKPYPLKIDTEVARIEVAEMERVRAYVEGLQDATPSDEIAFVAALIIEKIDDALGKLNEEARK